MLTLRPFLHIFNPIVSALYILQRQATNCFFFTVCLLKMSPLNHRLVVIFALKKPKTLKTLDRPLPPSVSHPHTTTTTTLTLPPLPPWRTLTHADALVVQFGGGVAEVAQPAVLAVLAPGVVLAADARDDVQVVDVAAAVGVAVALAV